MATDEIQKAYQDLFGRSADDAGLAYWSSQGLSGSALTNALTGAAQGSDRTALVNHNYEDLFGRGAEATGSNYWTSDDTWNKYASGGLDKLMLQMAGGSQGKDEFSLIDNLKSDGGNSWSKAFYDPTNADAVWKSLLDDEGFNGKSSLPAAAKPTTAATQMSGGFQDYLNPYLDDVLNSGIRKINEQGDLARNRLGTSAFQSGAYGDARHGIEGDNLTQSLMDSIGDLTAQTKAQGFESAMSHYGQDLDRQSNIALQNANLQNQWANTQINGSNTANSIGLNDYTQGANWLSFLQNLDTSDRNFTQQGLNANYQDWFAGQSWDQNQLTALLNTLNAIPGQTSTYGTSSTPDNSWASSLGSSLQQAFGSNSAAGGGSSAGGGPSWLPPNFV